MARDHHLRHPGHANARDLLHRADLAMHNLVLSQFAGTRPGLVLPISRVLRAIVSGVHNLSGDRRCDGHRHGAKERQPIGHAPRAGVTLGISAAWVRESRVSCEFHAPLSENVQV